MNWVREEQTRSQRRIETISKILVTGAAGYVGSVLTETLAYWGHSITAVDNLFYDQVPFGNLFRDTDLKFIRGDVTNEKLMKSILQEKFDYIFPLAAIVGFQPCSLSPGMAKITNLDAVDILLQHRNPDSRIISPTTNSGYGTTDGSLECDENTPLTPISEYGQTKVEAERHVRMAGNSISFRLATLFGFSPRMRTDLLVNDFVLRAMRERMLVIYEKNYTRNVLHVQDACNAFVYTMDNWDLMTDNVYNLGNSRYNITKNELALMIQKKLPATKIIYVDDQKDPDQRNYLVSNKRIEATGFGCTYTLEDGIDELIRGYATFTDRRFRNI
jgi:nucleoside-diphosphate-sugar epimerase